MSKVLDFVEHFNEQKRKGANRAKLVSILKKKYEFYLVCPVQMIEQNSPWKGFGVILYYEFIEYDEKNSIAIRLQKEKKPYIIAEEDDKGEIKITSYADEIGGVYQEASFSSEAFLIDLKIKLRELISEFTAIANKPNPHLLQNLIQEEIKELRTELNLENMRKELCDVLYLLSQGNIGAYNITYRQCSVSNTFYFGVRHNEKMPEVSFDKKEDLLRYFKAVHASNMSKFVTDIQLANVLRAKEKNQIIEESPKKGYWVLKNAEGKVVKPITYRKYFYFLNS